MEPVSGSRFDGLLEVLSNAAATFDLDDAQALHSTLELVFLRSPLTETPLTAFLVHSERPSRRTPQASFTGLRGIRSPPLGRLWESILDVLTLLVNIGNLLISPRFSIEMIDPYRN